MSEASEAARMIDRQAAAQATVEKFRGAAFEWGRHDCVRLAAFALEAMGHQPRPELTRAGRYRTARGAVGALRRAGHATLADALDAAGLQRIAPAAALAGDIVMTRDAGLFDGSLMIAVGNGRAIGWVDGHDVADILQPVGYLAAWRV